jgi:hypothetical protein
MHCFFHKKKRFISLIKLRLVSVELATFSTPPPRVKLHLTVFVCSLFHDYYRTAKLTSLQYEKQSNIPSTHVCVFVFLKNMIYLSMLHYLQKYYMLYLTICTYNITFLIVVMVITTVCYLLGTLLESVEVFRFNKCTKFLVIFSDEFWFACWPSSYFLRKILSVGFWCSGNETRYDPFVCVFISYIVPCVRKVAVHLGYGKYA